MFSRRLIPLGVACLAFGVSAVHAQTPLTFQQALATARDRAPRVAVARARIEEARGRLIGAQVRFRDNPVIDASAGPRRLETGTVTDYEFGIGQAELGNRRFELQEQSRNHAQTAVSRRVDAADRARWPSPSFGPSRRNHESVLGRRKVLRLSMSQNVDFVPATLPCST